MEKTSRLHRGNTGGMNIWHTQQVREGWRRYPKRALFSIMADEENLEIDGMLISDMRVVELKKELEVRGLSKTGSKKELVKRLKGVSS